jgi:hypothetical protein
MLLAAAPDNAGMGIVQDVVLIGAPVSSGVSDWLQIRRVCHYFDCAENFVSYHNY